MVVRETPSNSKKGWKRTQIRHPKGEIAEQRRRSGRGLPGVLCRIILVSLSRPPGSKTHPPLRRWTAAILSLVVQLLSH